jgi:hypothetical protein
MSVFRTRIIFGGALDLESQGGTNAVAMVRIIDD